MGWMAAALLMMAGAPLRAEDVMTEHQGLDVSGRLDVAPGKSPKTDGVTLIVHGSLGHHRMEIISALQELLRERGVNSLAITLSLGLDRRRGMFECTLEHDHRHEDAVEEIETWVDWLKGKGVANITLAGHDRGAAQAALYASQPRADRAVKRLVLAAPLLQNFESIDAEYFLKYKKVLRDELGRAEQMVSQDEASSLLDGVGFLDCPDAKVTAGAFVNYYSNNEKLFTPNLLPAVKIPTLVVGAGADPQEGVLATAMRQASGQRNVIFEEVARADHYFSDVAVEDLAERIADFVNRKGDAMAATIPADAGPAAPLPPQGVKMKPRK